MLQAQRLLTKCLILVHFSLDLSLFLIIPLFQDWYVEHLLPSRTLLLVLFCDLNLLLIDCDGSLHEITAWASFAVNF